jgi:hypothetical protein
MARQDLGGQNQTFLVLDVRWRDMSRHPGWRGRQRLSRQLGWRDRPEELANQTNCSAILLQELFRYFTSSNYSFAKSLLNSNHANLFLLFFWLFFYFLFV